MDPDDLGRNIDTLQIKCLSINNPELCKSMFASHYNFKIMSFNIRSIEKNFDNFYVTLTRLNSKIDVIVLSECWLNESTIIPQIPGYTSYQTTKIRNQNGGIIIYVENSYSATTKEPRLHDSDCLLIEIKQLITIVGIYRSPSIKNADPFLLSLENLLIDLKKKHNLIICGDININIIASTTNHSSTEYLSLIAEHGLRPSITLPTRGDSCLDHIMIRSRGGASGLVCNSDITDHDIAITGVTLTLNAEKLPRRRLKRNVEAIILDLRNEDWLSVINEKVNVNVALKKFMTRLMNIINLHTKVISLTRSKYNLKPWITPGLIKCMKHRDKLHMQLRADVENEILKITYKRYRNFCNNLLRKIKSDYEKKELEESYKNSKKLWKTIQDLLHFKKPHQNLDELLKPTQKAESLNLCNNYFSNLGQNLANDILSNTSETEESIAANVRSDRSTYNSFFMNPTDEFEVEALISQLQNGKSTGIDDLSNGLIKHIGKEIIKPLTAIFNLSLSTGVFPDDWKIALISPIHKSGPKDKPENYRPISLLGTFSKLLEKIVNKRLISFLESHNILSERQFGFRPNKSAEDAVLLLISIVSNHLDKRKGCIGLFLDLAKAFDTVSTVVLLRKLECTGIRGTPLEWFKSYLLNRRQCTKVGNFKSDIQNINFGVPQGSILGPTLFILYVNDIHTLQLKKADIICYADDTALIFHGSTWDETYQNAHQGISTVSKWLRGNLLTLNTAKTKYLCFRKNAMTAPGISYNLKIHNCGKTSVSTGPQCNCDEIGLVNEIKYLGILIDHNFSFKSHIEFLSGRVRKLTGIMRKLRDVANATTLRLIYISLCKSLLSYCILSWGSAVKSTLIVAERAQRSVLKVMLKKPFRYPTTLLYKEADVLTVRQIFILKAALLKHKQILQSPNVDAVFNKRVVKVNLPSVRTAFAGRFGPFVVAKIYNNISKTCNLKNCTTKQAKKVITDRLKAMTYKDTEDILTANKIK